jgi:hypothetical protein
MRSSGRLSEPPPAAEDEPTGKRRRGGGDDDDADGTAVTPSDNAAGGEKGDNANVTSPDNGEGGRATKAVKFDDTAAAGQGQEEAEQEEEEQEEQGMADAAATVHDAEPSQPEEATPEPPIKRKRGRPPGKKNNKGGAASAGGAKTPGTATKTPKPPKAPRCEPTPGTRQRLPRATRDTWMDGDATPGVDGGDGGGESSAAAEARRRLRSQEKPAGDDDDDSDVDMIDVVDMKKRVPLPEGWVPPPPVRCAAPYAVSAELRPFVDDWKRQRKERCKPPVPRGAGAGDVGGGGGGGELGQGQAGQSLALQTLQQQQQQSLLPPAPPQGEALELLAGAAAGPYSTMRALSRTLKLSPFTLDALVGALVRLALHSRVSVQRLRLDWLHGDHTGCHQLNRVLTHNNHAMKSANPTRWRGPRRRLWWTTSTWRCSPRCTRTRWRATPSSRGRRPPRRAWALRRRRRTCSPAAAAPGRTTRKGGSPRTRARRPGTRRSTWTPSRGGAVQVQSSLPVA